MTAAQIPIVGGKQIRDAATEVVEAGKRGDCLAMIGKEGEGTACRSSLSWTGSPHATAKHLRPSALFVGGARASHQCAIAAVIACRIDLIV